MQFAGATHPHIQVIINTYLNTFASAAAAAELTEARKRIANIGSFLLLCANRAPEFDAAGEIAHRCNSSAI